MGDRENLPELLKGWAKTKIGEIIECLDSQRVPVSKEARAERAGNIPYYGANGQVDWIDDYLFDEPLVLVVEDETFIGREKPFSYKITGKSWVNNHAHVLRAIAVDTDYLNYSLWYYPFTPLTTGTTGRRKLTKSALMSAPYVLPPLAEQHRIVAKIDELFTQLDAGVELLKKLKAKLKRYRQAVLKVAVEGKLTKDWREAHQGELEPASVLLERILKERREKWEAEQVAQMKAKGKTPKDDSWKLKYKEPVAPDTSDLPELPEEWVWASTQQLGEVQLGRQRSPKNRSKDYPTKYIRAANITEKGLDLSDVLDMEFEPHEWGRYLLRDGDILLSEASGSPDQVGKPAIWREQIPHCCFQNTVIRLRALNLSSEYLLIIFKSFYFNGLFARVAAGVGINHLSANKFCAIAVPLAPLLEQDYIITTVDYHISIAEKLEAIIEVNLKRAERLRQSILKKAFEGKLVPQDPTDEPADKLLERIKAEKAKREAEAKAKKKRKQPGKSQQLELF